MASIIAGLKILDKYVGEVSYPGPDNTWIDASDTAVNMGDVFPPDIFEALRTECSTVGCSGAKVVSRGTNVVSGSGHLGNLEITLSAEASFNPDGISTRDNMFELLKAVSEASGKFEDTSYISCGGTPFCGSKTIKQHWLSQTIHITTTEDNGDDAFLNVFIGVARKEDAFCAKVLGGASYVGGAVNGVVGGVFGLASLACA